MGLEIVLKKDKKEIGSFEMNEKNFKTGSVGYHTFGKIEIDGKRYQANFMLVEIGSKKKNEVSL